MIKNLMLKRLEAVQKTASRVHDSLRVMVQAAYEVEYLIKNRDEMMTKNKWTDARYSQEFERHMRRYRTANNRFKAATSKLDKVD